MTLKIRLARGGAKKRPYYRIVVADRTRRAMVVSSRRSGQDPILPKGSPDRVTLDTERVKHWLSVGAQPTDRVARFLDASGLKPRQARNNPTKALPGKKRAEREKAEAEARKAREEAEAQPQA